MLELYYLEEADSICSNRAVMTLAEKGITDWTPHKIVLMDGDQFTPEYQALNTKSQVPTLVHDGKVIRESSIICRYPAVSFPVVHFTARTRTFKTGSISAARREAGNSINGRQLP